MIARGLILVFMMLTVSCAVGDKRTPEMTPSPQGTVQDFGPEADALLDAVIHLGDMPHGWTEVRGAGLSLSATSEQCGAATSAAFAGFINSATGERMAVNIGRYDDAECVIDFTSRTLDEVADNQGLLIDRASHWGDQTVAWSGPRFELPFVYLIIRRGDLITALDYEVQPGVAPQFPEEIARTAVLRLDRFLANGLP
jgi:hypothetical protein